MPCTCVLIPVAPALPTARWDSFPAAALCCIAAADIASGLAYLHGQKVVHGDLAHKNVRVSSTAGLFCFSAQTYELGGSHGRETSLRSESMPLPSLPPPTFNIDYWIRGHMHFQVFGRPRLKTHGSLISGGKSVRLY